MSFELSKSDKKAARNLIELGSAREIAQGLKEFDAIISDWKTGSEKNGEAYWALSEAVKKHNKLIQGRYGDIRGSAYLLLIIGLMADEVIFETDLAEFSNETRDYLIRAHRGLYK